MASRPVLAPSVAREEDPLASLVEGARDGEPRSVRALLDAVAPDVARVVRLIAGAHAPDVDDLVQEALLALLRAVAEFRGECSVRRFARRVAARSAMTARRRAARKAMHHERWAQGTMHEREDVPSHDARMQAIVRELLVELPVVQAEALVHRVVLGATLEEIASATGVPLNTVRSRLRLAKEALRKRIEADPKLREALGGPK
jgi:RNA polymerase sigma factor (sigma-70 family)